MESALEPVVYILPCRSYEWILPFFFTPHYLHYYFPHPEQLAQLKIISRSSELTRNSPSITLLNQNPAYTPKSKKDFRTTK